MSKRRLDCNFFLWICRTEDGQSKRIDESWSQHDSLPVYLAVTLQSLGSHSPVTSSHLVATGNHFTVTLQLLATWQSLDNSTIQNGSPAYGHALGSKINLNPVSELLKFRLLNQEERTLYRQWRTNSGSMGNWDLENIALRLSHCIAYHSVQHITLYCKVDLSELPQVELLSVFLEFSSPDRVGRASIVKPKELTLNGTVHMPLSGTLYTRNPPSQRTHSHAYTHIDWMHSEWPTKVLACDQ